jgi:hypothetical protein
VNRDPLAVTILRASRMEFCGIPFPASAFIVSSRIAAKYSRLSSRHLPHKRIPTLIAGFHQLIQQTVISGKASWTLAVCLRLKVVTSIASHTM